MDAFTVIRTDPLVEKLARSLKARRGVVAAEGLWGSSAPILAAIVAEQLGRPLLLVTGHSDDADDARDDIEAATGQAPELFPQLESVPGEEVASDDLLAERLRLCVALLSPSEAPPRLVCSVMALMQPVPAPEAIRARSLTLNTGQELDPDRLADWLAGHGFERCDAVEVPGDFARRGGIVDIFSHAHTDPVRIEFFGDEISSIRLFDPATQRSTTAIGALQIPALRVPKGNRAGGAARDGAGRDGRGAHEVGEERDGAVGRDGGEENGEATTSFLRYLPEDTVVAIREPAETQELGGAYLRRIGERPGIIPVERVLRTANEFTQLYLQRFPGVAADAIRFNVSSLPQFEAKAVDAIRALGELAASTEVFVLCDNAAEQQRLRELLSGAITAPTGETPALPGDKTPALPGGETPALPKDILARVHTEIGVVHHGFQWERTAIVPHHELFHRYRQRRTLRRVAPARPIDSFFDLQQGDHVVHVIHGIGRFLGLKTLERDGRADEYLAIEFDDHAVVNVPISQIHLVQKYIGSFKGKPRLSKLGGTGWKRTKERVAEAVGDMAAELLAVQARRATEVGVAYPRDTEWQREFEESFLYKETEDQLRALEEIKGDLTRPRPMDRLLCGDVGYGKTELAVRAAFKVVEYGKQVAVLVPTTVLAEQHVQTFRERLAAYPFSVEVLSRFRTARDQKRIVEAAQRGQVDILIGTHRLLSPDVRFADLGLVVIDEEQRFGVDAKERLKRLRATVDLLTLTATPIPRTLHMAMLGIRDISSLATAPLDRRAIVTQVRTWDDRLIREAIVRELNRDGQCYFVHNFVRDIHNVANHLRALVPEARFVVGHGQMASQELEDVMVKFLHREADVLVSTNIIESGLDIPAANTIFIDRADRFGLADLHQLRGRVGRSKHRAYAYMLLSPRQTITEIAARRLKAIEHYSDLGAGFQIALRDLEIRGAGNILGAEQSGHIEAVGYEMYCQLLEQAVRKMRNEPAETYRPVNLDLGISASLPRAYIRADRQRMEVYKRLTACRTLEELDDLRGDIRDAFGPPPPSVETLLQLAEIRVLAAPWGIRSITLVEPDLVFAIDELPKVQPLFREGPGSPRIPDANTIHWRLPKRYLDPGTLVAVLRHQLQRSSESAQEAATSKAS